MEMNIYEEQRAFALRQMELENIAPKKVVVIKRKPVTKPKRKIFRIVKTEDQIKAEEASVTLALEAWEEKTNIYNARRDLFDLNVSASLAEIAGLPEPIVDEEERFVKFLIAERARVKEWIESQNFPEFERTQEDYEDESRERLAFKIYHQHIYAGLLNL